MFISPLLLRLFLLSSRLCSFSLCLSRVILSRLQDTECCTVPPDLTFLAPSQPPPLFRSHRSHCSLPFLASTIISLGLWAGIVLSHPDRTYYLFAFRTSTHLTQPPSLSPHSPLFICGSQGPRQEFGSDGANPFWGATLPIHENRTGGKGGRDLWVKTQI